MILKRDGKLVGTGTYNWRHAFDVRIYSFEHFCRNDLALRHRPPHLIDALDGIDHRSDYGGLRQARAVCERFPALSIQCIEGALAGN